MASLEELLADTQSEMIAVCAEYANGAASDIFVYASVEDRTLFFDPFFVVRGNVVTRGELHSHDESLDSSDLSSSWQNEIQASLDREQQ